MSERYWVTGVQLGIIEALTEAKHYVDDLEKYQQLKKLLEDILDQQFIGNIPNPYEEYDIKIVKKVNE